MSGQLSEVEERARVIVSRHLGIPVEQHDDGSQSSLPDLRIIYSDRPWGLVEVVRDVEHHSSPGVAKRDEPNQVRQRKRLDSQGWMVESPDLATHWQAVLTVFADVAQVRADLPAVLKDLEGRGDRILSATWFRGSDPLAVALHQLGVERVVAAQVTPFIPPGVSFVLESGQVRNGSLELVVPWCEAVLAREADVGAKLANADCSERHAFIVATSYGDSSVFGSLVEREWHFTPGEPASLPRSAPRLPPGVERVWIMGGQRVIAWFPEKGWLDVARRDGYVSSA